MEKRKKVALYVRCSTSKDQSLDLQLDILREYVKSRSWEIIHEFQDFGFSGGSNNRPALQELIQQVRRGVVNVVCVSKLDRFFRSLRHLVVTLDEFEELGCQFISVGDQIDFTTSAGRLHIQIIGAFAEFERSLIRERTIAGLDAARRRGKSLGRPSINKESEIIHLRENGLSYRAIQDKLGISASVVTRVLKAHGNPLKNSTKKPSDSEGDFS